MKNWVKKVCLLIMLGMCFTNVYAQKSDDILALSNEKVAIEKYESTYSPIINEGKMVLVCYINEYEYFDYYFYTSLDLKEDLAQKILADIHSYKADTEQMRTYFFESNEVESATQRQMHQLKRDRVLAVVKDKGNIVVVSYEPRYYKQHLLNK